MTTKTISIRDLVREGKKITKYDYVDIEDKKTKQYKGIFVSYRYAEEVKKFLEKKRKDKINKIMKFSGMASGLFKKKDIQSVKSIKKK